VIFRRAREISCAAVTIVLLAHVGAASAQTPRTIARAQFQRAFALWSSLRVHSYSFRIRFGGFPIPAGDKPVRITVRNGRADHGGSGGVLDGNGGLPLNTVANLFREIRHVLADPQAGDVTVRYDTRRGIPVYGSLDPTRSGVDDEFSWRIDAFAPGR